MRTFSFKVIAPRNKQKPDKKFLALTREEWLKLIPIIIGFLAFYVSARALNNSSSSLSENQREFKIKETVYLQIDKTKAIVEPNKSPTILYSLDNLSSAGAKIISADFLDSISIAPVQGALTSRRFIDFGSVSVNRYAIKESPYVGQYTPGYQIPAQVVDDIKAGKDLIYFTGTIHYLNTITQDSAIYRFNLRLHDSPEFGIDMLENENTIISH
jgi:hypothetical protein